MTPTHGHGPDGRYALDRLTAMVETAGLSARAH